MPHLNPTDQHGDMHQSRWLLGGVISICVLVLTLIVGSSILIQGEAGLEETGSALGYTQAQLMEDMIHEAHDELIMLIISLVVVIQVVATFKFLRWLPYRPLVLCSFGAVALSAFCTVVEGLVFEEVLNFIEHLSFMVASILLAVWCGLWTFGSKQKESL